MIPSNHHPSWDDFFTKEIYDILRSIEKELTHPFNPEDPSRILRFLQLDLNAVKVIWLGQDVYPAKGAATGRAFEVATIKSWCQPFKQVSLKNIVRLIHKSYNDIIKYQDIYAYNRIKEAIENKEFNILPYKEWFDSLENQGVMFLNTAFTCKVNQANSHQDLWAPFSEKLLTFIGKKRPDMIWFLWGKSAISKKSWIQQGIFYESRHPMMCSEKYPDDFLKNPCFKETMGIIEWLGK